MLGLTLDILRAAGIGVSGGSGGPGPSPGYTPPLDAYSNTILAYSVRKLSSTYSGPCIQVRRESDGLTQDIGFDSNGLIATADIVSFCSGSVGTVAVWYDQGSLGQNATQSDPLKQPTIYSGTDFFYLGEVPFIQASGTEQFDFSITHSGNWTNLMVMSPTSGSGDSGWTYGNSGGAGIGSINAGNTTVALYYGAISNISGDSRVQNLYSLYFDNSGIDWFRNAVGNTGVGSGLSGFSWDTFMSRRASDSGRMAMQEFLMWDTDLIASQEILETNLNDYYQVTNLPYYSSGFLADYPDAAAAYSVRKLSNTAIKCMRVRRFVPPYDEQDIGFTAGGDLDEAAIVAFGGSDELRVSTWYDQSGQSNHAAQIDPNSQPQIYNGTEVITENDKPILSGGSLNYSAITYTNNLHSTFYVCRFDANAIYASALGSGAGQYQAVHRGGSIFERIGGVASYHGLGISATKNAQHLISILDDATETISSVDGTSATVSSAGPWTASVASTHRGEYGISADVKIQELIVYQSDQETAGNRTGIETKINKYYDIYTMYNPDPATSGFLFDYPDASTAYSVRQLNNNATVSMRVRRAVAPFDEQDIEFVNGDLDEAAIVAFGGSDTLTVSAWYDQSGNQNHAKQITPGNQPQIYNGTAVLTENGKPIISRVNNSTGFEATAVDMSGSTISVSSVSLATTTASIMVWFGTSLTERLYTGTSSSTLTDGGQAGFNTASAELFWNGSSQGTSATRGEVYTQFTNNQTLASWVGLKNLAGTQFNLSQNVGYWQMHNMQEIIFWESDQSSNRTGIETNINDYFNIYT